MIALLQRVRSASVSVDDVIVAQIGVGLLVFIGVRPADEPNGRHGGGNGR